MANTALRGCIPVLFTCHMALVAHQGLVLAPERKVRLVVIKFLFIKTCNLGFTPFVIGVATVTSLRFLSAMKAGFCAHISPHVFVTVHAQTRLGLTGQLDVTLLAVVFQFDVALNNFPRCQHRFDALRTRQPGQRPPPRHHRDEECESLPP